ncbi:hypothetical protein GCM10022223_06650 [Kineosporia mesophila]|uniref:Mycodextranase n=1 Tax=Kineosporia mesophila TaxID=566012 RepID=A0ABP6Z0Z7_9ACTN|nr:glycosyl hydrolase family 28-related protein [Kineosporia mesophila]MCD5351044.1 right-handed parallel beta-helix repeat-containing protein [Kineosporia mesophila]
MKSINRRIATAVAAAGLLTAGVAAMSATAAEETGNSTDETAATTTSTISAVSPVGVDGRGAQVPFQEVEAEDATTDGTVIGPDRTYGTLPSEASGRRAVTLDAVGEYVEFTLPAAANSMVLRYSLPDNATGTGRDARVAVESDGGKLTDLGLTSKYGWFYGTYPFTDTPGENPHHFYDEARTLFGKTLPAGSKVRVSVTSISESPTLTVDLADFEMVDEAAGSPAGALDVVKDYGADATGRSDATGAIQKALYDGASQGRSVWIPEGTFKVTDHLIVDDVTVTGAGPWRSVLTGDNVGFYGKYVADGGPSRNVTVKNLAIIGETTDRDDSAPRQAIGGAMSDSVVDNVWMQHTKVGAWMDGPMDNFTLRNSRILDTTADGVNFHQGVTNSTVQNTFVRNTGDDGLAMWAQDDDNTGNTFTQNTVVAPILANNIAIYGGEDITVTKNVVADTVVNGGGIHVGNRYPGVQGATAVQGTFELSGNTLIRAGNLDSNWKFGIGALWFDGLNEGIGGVRINVRDTTVLDSSYAAIQVVGSSVTGLNFSGVTVDGTGSFVLQLQASGSASFQDVTATNIGATQPVYDCGSGFTVTDEGGNSGWSTRSSSCGSMS